MPKMLLTDLSVRALKGDAQVDYWDTKTPGFGVRVGKRSKTFVAKLFNRRSTIGTYPAISIQDARKRFLSLKVEANPVVPKVPSFQDAIDLFLEARRTQLKPRSHYELTRSLKRHFHWHKTLDAITHNDVAFVIDGIAAKSEASHALKDVKGFFSWCVPRYLAHSPCEGLKPPARYVPRSRLLTDDEVRKIWKAAEQMGGYGRQVQLLFATGQRASQIIKLEPTWIDDKTRLIRFPASIMKSNRDHALPFGDLTARLLAHHDIRPTSYQGKRKAELDELAKVRDWVLHDARRYYSSTHAQLKTPIDITEAILSHISGSRSQIQQIYDVYDRLDEMREAVARWEKRLAEVVL